MLSKIKYQLNDLVFNYRLLTFRSLLIYYFYSYLFDKEFVTVKIKALKVQSVIFTIRCRNRFDRNGIHNTFFNNFHYTKSAYLDKDRPVILDLGSNIGLTVIDFKILHPNAVIYGFEMDLDNYNLALINCRKFSNIHLFNKAVWIKKGHLSYSRGVQTDAFSINDKCSEGKTEVESTTILDLIQENGIQRIDFLKMDIEGVEVDIFNDSNLEWLKSVYSLNIEFHNVSNQELNYYVELLNNNGFKAWLSLNHWSAIEAIRKN